MGLPPTRTILDKKTNVIPSAAKDLAFAFLRPAKNPDNVLKGLQPLSPEPCALRPEPCALSPAPRAQCPVP